MYKQKECKSFSDLKYFLEIVAGFAVKFCRGATIVLLLLDIAVEVVTGLEAQKTGINNKLNIFMFNCLNGNQIA